MKKKSFLSFNVEHSDIVLVKELPFFFQAIRGHLSLIHATYANDDDLMQTGRSVKEWKNETQDYLSSFGRYDYFMSRIFLFA